MYKRDENVNLIVTETLNSFHLTIPKFKWITKTFFEINVGSDGGFNPEISFWLRGNKYDELSPSVEILFFLHGEDGKSVMIYTGFNPQNDDDVLISEDIEVTQSVITPYFEKAMHYIGADEITNSDV